MTNRKINKIVMIILAMVIFLLGFFGIIITNKNTLALTEKEHYTHLLDLAHSIDHNILNFIDNNKNELYEFTQINAVIDASKKQDINKIKEIIKINDMYNNDAYYDILIENNDARYSVNGYDNNFVFYNRVDNGSLWLCVDSKTQGVFFGSSMEIGDTNTYILLITPCEKFYHEAIIDEIYDDYWIVLVDTLDNIAFQNDDRQPVYITLTEEEALKRDDGYTIVYQSQKEGKIKSESYKFSLLGTTYEARISVIPNVVSQNKDFSIGVSIYGSHIISVVQNNVAMVTISVSATIISLAILLYLFIFSDKIAKQLTNKVINLEQEKQEMSEIEHSKRLETIGRISAGISHEFNNLLSPIMSESLLALEKVDEDSEIYDNLLDIYQSSNKAKTLVKRINRLSRKETVSEKAAINPNELIDNVYSIVHSSIYKNVNLEKEYNANKCFYGDASQIDYMLINLIMNATQALEKTGGNVLVKTFNDEEYVYISVIDDGPGIPEEIKKQIFEPFFTTKPSSKGTGLGLSISLQIANDNDGELTEENNPEGGANFTFKVKACQTDRE